MDKKYSTTYKIRYIWYEGKTSTRKTPLLCLTLYDFKIGEDNSICSIGSGPMIFRLNKEGANAQEIDWDGTEKGVEKVKENLEGKVFELNLGIKNKIN